MDANKTGKLIAKKRKEKNLTQKNLGKIINVTDSTISKWECGLGFPDISMLEILSKTLGVTIEDLYVGEQTYKSSKKKIYKKSSILILSLLVIFVSVYSTYYYQSRQFDPVPYLKNTQYMGDEITSPYISYQYNNLFLVYYGYSANNTAVIRKTYNNKTIIIIVLQVSQWFTHFENRGLHDLPITTSYGEILSIDTIYYYTGDDELSNIINNSDTNILLENSIEIWNK